MSFFMYIDRRSIMETFLRILGHIADKEYQERVWIRGEGPECDDFDETCCHFSQEGDGILADYQAFGVSDAQYRVLKRFRDTFEIFADTHDWPPEFIDTLEWEKIRGMAQEVLLAFRDHA